MGLLEVGPQERALVSHTAAQARDEAHATAPRFPIQPHALTCVACVCPCSIAVQQAASEGRLSAQRRGGGPGTAQPDSSASVATRAHKRGLVSRLGRPVPHDGPGAAARARGVRVSRSAPHAAAPAPHQSAGVPGVESRCADRARVGRHARGIQARTARGAVGGLAALPLRQATGLRALRLRPVRPRAGLLEQAPGAGQTGHGQVPRHGPQRGAAGLHPAHWNRGQWRGIPRHARHVRDRNSSRSDAAAMPPASASAGAAAHGPAL